MIKLKNTTKYFRVGFFGIKKNAIEDLSLTIEDGKVTGFFGPNGAGKSTTIKMIVGLIHPSNGIIKINDYDSTDYRARLNLGYLPENPSFPRGLKGIEIINYYSKLLNKKIDKSEIYDALKLAGIFYAKDIHVHKYSKGMTQRLALAISILGDPEILIFDEPLSGLDPIGRKEFKDIIFKLKERKKTIFFSSHVLADSKELCDKIAVLVGGRLIKDEGIAAIEKEAEGYMEAKLNPSKNHERTQGTAKPEQDKDYLLIAEYSTPLEVYLYDLMRKNKKN
ncbi:MAG: ABC transporter ATP-binding protein [Candidatus Acidulodesulfobacterium ferriphilum]|uniref:ABC transporter ATP-binding protein n=1 Tax=Candidatus Acidulodesulfobacterium ferriphilum TaxID=2597223 RepID=A0A519BCL6_9DELT|nr:MAG: ABC transporter ATP-binding protein [Candidatus Acidulodesulfobacterium ferriphilum]